MMKQVLRLIHVSNKQWKGANKNDLSKLRKKTGYTFANCKKALEVNNNDLALAENWLKEQSQALGWSKAVTLQGRATLQGLIGVAVKSDSGVMVEINCETDFVARNKVFKSLTELATTSYLKDILQLERTESLIKTLLESKNVKDLIGPDNKSLGDHAALAISNTGENISLRRGAHFKVPQDMYLAGYTHPMVDNSSKVSYGKYGAIIAYRTPENDSRAQQIAKQLCQHIIGMNPEKIGVSEDEPMENKDDETIMIHQEFLLDPSITVSQLLDDAKINVLDFIRFECGEAIEKSDETIPLKVSQTI